MSTKPTDNLTERLRDLLSRASCAGGEKELDELVERFGAEIRERINAERLEAAARMAGWLAHRINNPLGAISGNAQLLARRLARDGGEAAEGYMRYIDAIQSETERSARITAELLDFTRPRDPVLAAVEIGPVVEEAAELAGFGAGQENVIVDLESFAGLPRARTDKELLVRALYEVVLNGMQAAGQDGTVTISGSLGDGIEIRVRDTGPGISPDVLPRIFDPFFSSREKARGLGLTAALTIVTELGGTVCVTESGPAGAVVSTTVPADKG
jgi:signal transduction histidine kinase